MFLVSDSDTDMRNGFDIWNSGVYPSEILPYQLQFPSTKKQNSLLESLSAEINAAIGNLTNGYSRIIRLCRRVSKVIQSSRGWL